jgi:signal transduction histidine kinase
MTAATASAHTPPASPLTPRTVLAAWRGITPAQVATTFVLGCAHGLYTRIVYAPLHAWFDNPWAFLEWLGDQTGAFALLLAFVVADRVTGKDPNRRGAYVLAVVAGAIAGAILSSLALQWQGQFVWQFGANTMAADGITFVMRRLDFTLWAFFEWTTLGGAAVWLINDRRRARRARERMQGAELDRIAAAKRTVESELQAMQARVEPQFLFNTLAQVRDLYDVDKGRSALMLDELIAYLRAAMPRMRDTSSTVGQEIELVRAYMGVVRLRLGERLTFEIETPEQLADVRIPPMTMLPLVDHAIAHGLGEPRSTGSIRIRTGIADGKVRLEIADSGVGFLPETEGYAIAGIRERLAALYGDTATLELRSVDATVSTAVLEIPVQSVPSQESADDA